MFKRKYCIPFSILNVKLLCCSHPARFCS